MSRLMAADHVSQVCDLRIVSINISGLKRKTNYIRSTIGRLKPDFLLLQETNVCKDYNKESYIHQIGVDSDRSFFNYAFTKANGTCILCLSNSWKFKNVMYYDEGRTIELDIRQNDCKFKLINVYAPTNPTNRRVFFDTLLRRLSSRPQRENVILAGDFNVTLQDMDTTGKKDSHNYGRDELQTIIDLLRVKDCFRNLHPNSRETTFSSKTHNSSSRLDRIYVPNNVSISEAKHLPFTLDFTDHKGIMISSCSKMSDKGKFYGHWKFNDSLLENEEFIFAIKETIHANIMNVKNNTLEKFDSLNKAFKRIAINFSSRIERQRNERLKLLNDIIRSADKTGKIKDTESYLKMKEERDEILNHKYRGACLRSKLPIAQEKPTRAFLSIESSIQKSRAINAIHNKDGILVQEPHLITNACTEFYKELYSHCDTIESFQNVFLSYTRKLTDEAREVIERPLTTSDLRKAIFAMREDASPGPDGITVKFVKTFFNDLLPLFEALLNTCFAESRFTDCFNLSYTILLPKDSGSLLEIKNYRPISLLNTSFKIISKALANRVFPFLESLIHPDQAAVIKGRNIQQHNHFLRDLISLAKVRDDRACILSIDQMKAFDRVSHFWLIRVLKECNFGPNFIRWISIFYRNAKSKLLLNKSLSDSFDIRKGVRQGCILSPLLYILSLEPLLERIRQNVSISGLHIPNKGYQKLIAFADDTNFFTDNAKSIETILETFDEFGKCSGSKINISKTKCLAIGRGEKINTVEYNLEWVREIKIFGLLYANALNQSNEQNWEHILFEIKSRLKKIYYKQATMFGRAILVNTFIEPKLIYPASVFDPPPELLKEFKKIVRAFIFKGTISGIRHFTLVQDKSEGGINLHDFESKLISLRLKYINMIKNDPSGYPLGVFFLNSKIPIISLPNALSINNGNTPTFYEIIVRIFRSHENVCILTEPKSYYKKIIQERATNLKDQLKRANEDTDIKTLFLDLHYNIFTTPTQKQITYRIFFGITPTSEGLAKRFKKVYQCRFCLQEQETEEHMFYWCPFILDLKLNLLRLLRQPHNTFIDPYKAIFLNSIPKETTKDLYFVKLAIIAIYRETIWTSRNNATHNGYMFSRDHFLRLFGNKINFFFKLFKENEVVNSFVNDLNQNL